MAVTTSVEPLEGNKVKLHVAIPAADFERAIDAAFRKLAQEVKLPGFRPGKAPRKLLEARLGTEAARDQALRDSLPEYYVEAVEAEDIDVIAPPEIEITAGEDEGDVEFDAVVEVRPAGHVEGHDALQVEIPSPAIADEAVDRQVDRSVTGSPTSRTPPSRSSDGDYAEIDIKGYVHDESIEGLTATDFLYEVGSGIVVPKLDEELRGKRPGDILKFNDTLPERFGERAGDEVAFQVLVKEAKRKVLPELTDEWVDRDQRVRHRRRVARRRAQPSRPLRADAGATRSYATRCSKAASELVTDDVPDTLVGQEMERRLHDLAHRLEEQAPGLTIPQYLAASGQEQQAFVDGVREGAAGAVLADLALRAVVAQEAIEVTDAEVDAEVDQLAERLGEKPAKVRKDLERRGVVQAVRSDLERSKALSFLIEHATVVDEDGNVVDLSPPELETADPETADDP